MNEPGHPRAPGRAIDMTHGAGGKAGEQLIGSIFRKHFSNPFLDQGDDGAALGEVAGRLVMTTDGHVVAPLFFPGGDIGRLAVAGTVNDLAVMGAVPRFLTASFILEEGFPIDDLERIVISMAATAREAGAQIVAGDTKVVERGKADGVFIALTGLGVAPDAVAPSGSKARPGDAILVSGTMGDHGVAILSKRENLDFETEIVSDCQPLADLAQAMFAVVPGIRVMRDPTRGGLAATLNEIAHQSGVGMALIEAEIPIDPGVAAACELLGLDPLNIANEGKLLAICSAEDAERLLDAMRRHPRGRRAAIIGRVVEDRALLVTMRTAFGGSRVVDWIAGEQLPRIC
ncbi:MAG: hydrogenase expression/formation protein HypE [Phyllobacteriaceae bacterium]|nr:hydrogenase expression/formation protein HypE [Phyllobacteriaceae bacterium]